MINAVLNLAYTVLPRHMLSILLIIHLGVELVSHMATLQSTSCRTTQLFFSVWTFYMSLSKVEGF